ncbi:unnamed protein product [Tilletia laevis]|uniref:Stress-associated endoplasmic reticulum protein n=2 Tax=Tilletia TaxID=13289 RepID=A0A9N8LGN4_9BASI|nr:hypothetical protein CF335_g8357 [Tilletia laevis]KAE8259266.1 hypothetical protein A4X03_0g4139 [Tilletia caries]CAD6916783.1 unnamed protein product [Tilletia laevis]CAD6917211.1 unnamed protein product [Tilletia controversa]CAD6971017.1 unnamed protein product [Tilletia controversa]
MEDGDVEDVLKKESWKIAFDLEVALDNDLLSLATQQSPHPEHSMTSRQVRQKNEAFVKAARDGKKPVKPAFVERSPANKPAVHPAVLGVVVFVVVGGVFFELLRLFL